MTKRAKNGEHIVPREYLLRYEDIYDYDSGGVMSLEQQGNYICTDMDGEPLYAALKLRKYLVHSRTPCGVWLYRHDFAWYRDKLRFVKLQDWRGNPTVKRWAHVNEQDALASYKCRKQRQIVLLTHQIKKAEAGLRLANGLGGADGL